MIRSAWKLALLLIAVLLPLVGHGRAAAQAVASPVYYPPPAVTYYAPAPVCPAAPAVSYYYAPAVSYYPPAVSYYYAPSVSYYAPAVSYYASPAVVPGTAVTTTRYGLFGLRQVTTTRYYAPAYVWP